MFISSWLKIGVTCYFLYYWEEVKLTNAEMLQSDDEGIDLTSCSLSRSQSIIDDTSPEAYCKSRNKRQKPSVLYKQETINIFFSSRFWVFREEGEDITRLNTYQISRLLLPVHNSIYTTNTRFVPLDCRECSYKFLFALHSVIFPNTNTSIT